MKHNITHRKLNRTTSHRKALLMNLSNSLIKHEQITTTLSKAKELRPFVEKIITLGKKGDLVSRRKTISILQDQKNTKKIFDVISERYKERSGGYTRIIKVGNRFGDNAPTAIIELVDRDENAKGLDSGPVPEKKPSVKAKKINKKIFLLPKEKPSRIKSNKVLVKKKLKGLQGKSENYLKNFWTFILLNIDTDFFHMESVRKARARLWAYPKH